MQVAVLTALTMLLVVLKQTQIIDWSWFWILSPIFFPAFLFAAAVSLVITVGILMHAKENDDSSN
jgi:hypothetical protein